MSVNRSHFVRSTWVVAAAILILILSNVWLTHTLTEQYKQRSEQTLSSLLNSTHSGIKDWLRMEQARAVIWARRPDVIEATKDLLQESRDRESLMKSHTQQRLRHIMSPAIDTFNYDGFIIIAPDHINIASMRDSNTGTMNTLVKQPRVLKQVWSGQTAVSVPQEAEVELIDAYGQSESCPHTMFVLAPIRGDEGEVIAALAFRLSITSGLDMKLKNARPGSFGNSYVIDRNGVVIGHGAVADKIFISSHIDQYITDTKDHVIAKDPGINLLDGGTPRFARDRQPLTRMAASIAAGRSGSDVEGYRDLRGVPVLGAWHWDQDLGLGIAIEIERSKAYATLNLTRRSLSVLTGVASILCIVGTIILSTQKRRIYKSESLYRNLVTNLPAVTYRCSLDENEQIVFISEYIQALSGYPTTDFLGPKAMHYYDLIHPDDRPHVASTRRDAIQNRQPYSYEYRIVRADGGTRWVWERGMVVRDCQDHRGHIEAVITDITDRKDSARLRDLNKSLEAKTKEVEQFTYSVSHDLKSPLASCVGLIGCLEEDLEAYGQRYPTDLITRIKSNMDRMSRCIDDLLELTRIGRVRHEPVVLDMVQIARQIADDLSVQAIKVGATIGIAEDLPDAYADKIRVSEVIENLLSNALKYGTDNPSPTITIGWKQVKGKPHYFVRDNGKGVPESFQPKIFNLFEKYDKSNNGTGVGLTIVKRIIEVHGGEIWLESEPDRGATFYFSLPQVCKNEVQLHQAA